jgi:predicted dehydrogenase
MRELVQDGTLGKVILLRRRHCIGVLFNKDFLSAWHVKPEFNMGMFMDDASHAADFIYWVLGRPATCMAEIEPVLIDPAITPDDTGVAIYKYGDGKLAVLTNSSVTWVGENATEIYGEKGVVIENHGDGVSTGILPPHPILLKMFLAEQADKGWQDLGIPVPAGGHGERIQAVGPQALADYRAGTPRCTAREGKVSIEMVLAAYRSAAEGRRVRLDDL